MPVHSASNARKHFSSLLDDAAKGRSVLVRRRDQVFRLEMVPGAAAAGAPLFEADADLLDGEWSFEPNGTFR